MIVVAAATLGIASLSILGFGQKDKEQHASPATPAGQKSIVIGGGCFWCLDGMYRQLRGVTNVESGYAGGNRPNLNYEQVCSGTTGAAEVVKLTYDPNVVSASDLLHIFFTVHNPTTKNQQGGDIGEQYRSVIFYENDEQLKLAKEVLADVEREKIWSDPIVTTLEPLKNYTRAEEYHQDYYNKFEKASAAEKMSMNAGYCSAIIQPKVIKFRQKYADRLKKGS